MKCSLWRAILRNRKTKIKQAIHPAAKAGIKLVVKCIMAIISGVACLRRCAACGCAFPLLAVALLFGFVSAPQSANGNMVVETITGIVVSPPPGGGSYDQFGNVFSSSGTDTNLAGLPFTLTFTFDDTKGTGLVIVDDSNGNPYESYLDSTATSNVGTAVLTINGKSASFGTLGSASVSYGAGSGAARNFALGSPDKVFHAGESATNASDQTLNSIGGDVVFGCNLSYNWEVPAPCGPVPPVGTESPSSIQFQWEHDILVPTSNPDIFNWVADKYTIGYLLPTGITESGPLPPGSMPTPTPTPKPTAIPSPSPTPKPTPTATPVPTPTPKAPVPRILFLNPVTKVLVDATKSVQSVVVGERIQLFADPVGSGVSQPWEVKDSAGNAAKLVAGYQAPKIPSKYLTDKDISVGAITPVIPATTFSSPGETSFYFVTPGLQAPGTYSVFYHYTQSDGTPQFVVAQFAVDGPVAAEGSLSTIPSAAELPVKLQIHDLFGLRPIFGHFFPSIGMGPAWPSLPGIVFVQRATAAKSHSGYFFWAQVGLSEKEELFVKGKLFDSRTYTNYLDNSFPYVAGVRQISQYLGAGCYDEDAQDSPGTLLLAGWGELYWTLSFKMCLMWKCNDPSLNTITIPVAIGSVPWSFKADVVQKDGRWTYGDRAPNTAGATEPFSLITSPSVDVTEVFPQWDNVQVNKIKNPDPSNKDNTGLQPCQPPPEGSN
jgi:hypothetical protein